WPCSSHRCEPQNENEVIEGGRGNGLHFALCTLNFALVTLMLGVGEYFWRLLPANPILLRVVEAAGKKKRDLFIRCGYLGLLILVVIVSLISSSSSVTGMSLSDLSNS